MTRLRFFAAPLALAIGLGGGCQSPSAPPSGAFDLVLRGATLYDGGGGAPFVADLGLRGDRIAAIGTLPAAGARLELEVGGLALAPGFINMLSWADRSLLVDGRGLSDLMQGVTLELFGEGSSMGPLTEAMRARLLADRGDLDFEVPWTSLGEYLAHLERRGVSPNVASLVGATTVRTHLLGLENRQPSGEELARMVELVRQAMREGAMGVGSSLPYVPAVFASREELIALARAAAEFDGIYLSHIRDEEAELLEALDEFLEVVRASGVRGEVYHLKSSGKSNWSLFDAALAKLEAARAAGLAVSANVYPYPASSTGLTYNLPAWVQEGGLAAMRARLRDPALRARAVAEMTLIPPDDLWLVSFRNPALRPLVGQSLAAVARKRATTPEQAAVDLLLEDESAIGTVRFTMSEENVRKAIARPWVTFGSDGAALAPAAPFTLSQPHPRAYGTFARLLGRYVREERLLSLPEAIHRLTALPAERLRLVDRGRLAVGQFADLVVFDPATIAERATFEQPHQLAVGMRHVIVNGTLVVRDGVHTGAKPGRFVRGPGAKERP